MVTSSHVAPHTEAHRSSGRISDELRVSAWVVSPAARLPMRRPWQGRAWQLSFGHMRYPSSTLISGRARDSEVPAEADSLVPFFRFLVPSQTCPDPSRLFGFSHYCCDFCYCHCYIAIMMMIIISIILLDISVMISTKKDRRDFSTGFPGSSCP